MVAIVDYGVGNLHSVRKAFAYIGQKAEITSDADVIRNADHVLLPGVGAFYDARMRLKETGMEEAVREAVISGKPTLGICLGMQLLFENSLENGDHKGLGLLQGSVVPFTGQLKVPHMGWNSLTFHGGSPLFRGLKDGDHVYFVHSYHVPFLNEAGFMGATADYGVPFVAAIQKENLFATQFHPEKSGEVGLTMLKNFAAI
ncbi:MAG: imidazole glycerol phosphate synthase subunit HisH [Clostridiales bacterium]|nr:imidazole glycerol phosphate synthase subunit HisH [Clostridiales bacterium]